MNPLQSSLLHNADFLDMDVTFENCHDYPYLLNVTRFSYGIMKCYHKLGYNCVLYLTVCAYIAGIVAIVRMLKMTGPTCGAASSIAFIVAVREMVVTQDC